MGQQQLEKKKGKLLGWQSRDSVLPDLNIDADLLNECEWFLESNLPLLTDFLSNGDELDEIGTTFSGIFFDRLINAIRILNEMIILHDEEDETVGMELCTADDSVDIFHDEIDAEWVSALFHCNMAKQNMHDNVFLFQTVSTISDARASPI